MVLTHCYRSEYTLVAFLQIKGLIKKFIAKQETINLVVVPCNVDIATTEALKMAQEVDPEGERTLGLSRSSSLLFFCARLIDQFSGDSPSLSIYVHVCRLQQGS